MISYQDQIAAISPVRTWDFSDDAIDVHPDLATHPMGQWGRNVGAFMNAPTPANAVMPTVDLTDKPTGCTGSLKFTCPSESGAAASGQWGMNFSDDLSLLYDTEGDRFFVNVWVKFSSAFLSTAFDREGGGNGPGWKVMIVGQGDHTGCSTSSTGNCSTSNSPSEVVVQNTEQRGIWQMYRQPNLPLDEPFGPGNWKLQNAMPDPFCTYHKVVNLDDISDCMPFYADEWMQVQVAITLGARVSTVWEDSRVELWVAREGQTKVKVIDFTTDLNGNDFGKAWLAIYHTEKDDAQVHSVGHVRFAGMTLAETFIPMDASDLPQGLSRRVMVRR